MLLVFKKGRMDLCESTDPVETVEGKDLVEPLGELKSWVCGLELNNTFNILGVPRVPRPTKYLK